MNREPAAGRARLPVYLVHYDAPEWCKASVESLRASEGVDLDLTVIDNGGARGLDAAELERLGTSVLRSGGNVGFAGGVNRAFADWLGRTRPTDLCLIGSHDLHVEPEALRRLVEAAGAFPGFGVLGPTITWPRPYAGGSWDGARPRGLPPANGGEPVLDRDWVSGTCMLVRRACCEAVGGFDGALSSYVEDVDYCLRARDLGWRVGVVPAASVHGLGSASPLATALIEANIVYLCAKRGGWSGGLKAWSRLAGRAGRILLSLVLHRPGLRPAGSSLRATSRGLLLAAGKLWRLGRRPLPRPPSPERAT